MKKTTRKPSRGIIIFIATFIMTVSTSLPLFASDASDMVPDLPNEPYSLTVIVKSMNRDGTRTNIKGAKIRIFQVASLRVKHTAAYYDLTDPFAECKVTFEDMTASESNNTANPVYADGVPTGTVETRSAWYPSVSSSANGWQIVNGDYRDGENGATTQVTNKSKSVVIRKNVLPTATENIFTIALKVRAEASWVDLLDATSMRIQNGNSDNSSKVHYFQIKPTGTSSVPVQVYFMNAPNSVSENSLPGNYKVVYKKTYYLDPSNAGNWFLYFNNPLIGMGNHGGQKQKVEGGAKYYIPIGTTMQNYEALHHAAVAKKVIIKCSICQQLGVLGYLYSYYLVRL